NHALFKSTLFFTAGNIYQATHTLNVEKMGGLLKKLPVTGLVFLVSAVAICGLPPMNGFVSEMMIYLGLFDMLSVGTDPAQFGIICSIVALVMIGGLAILCFTKAFGVVFLGEPRSQLPEYREFSHSRMFMPALLCVVMLSVGIYPELYIGWINRILPLFGTSHIAFSGTIATIGRISAVTIAVVALLWLVRKAATKNSTIETGPTWGCGYTVESPKLQYTATSFVKSYSEIFGGLLKSGLLEKIAAYYLKFTGRFAFLQNGHLQFYILYGILFIVTTIILTLVIC
ncbi:MAG: hypothetical protein HUJ90_03775, partial [Bacteroidales bacterium]|nr:hypothetical protein [Bacteroidales bacterium]